MSRVAKRLHSSPGGLGFSEQFPELLFRSLAIGGNLLNFRHLSFVRPAYVVHVVR